MIKGMSKTTSLIVAAATMLSIVPASASDYKKISSEDGIIYNAIAFKDGASLIDGEVKDNDGAYYLKDGKYSELEDVDSGSKYVEYGTKYVNVDDGDYFLNLETGKVTDDSIAEDDEDDAASALRKKIKESDRYKDTVPGTSRTVFGDTDIADLTEITGNKFSESWYETKIAEDVSASSNVSKTNLTDGTTPYFTIYTDIKGNYIDADYNLGKIKVSTTSSAATTTSAAVTIENTKDTYDLRGNDTSAKISQSITLGQDSNYIYRYARISVTTTSDKNGQVFINGRAFNITSGTAGNTCTVDLKVIQKISKTQDSDDIDDGKYSKNVTNYVIGDDNAVLKSNSDEENYLNLAKDTTNNTKARVLGGKLVLFQISDNSNDDNVKVQSATLKSKNGYYYTDVEKSANITAEFNDDLDKTAFDTDVDGNLYVLESGYVKKFDSTDDWDKVYKVDGSMDALSVYDKNNMVAWSQDDEVYSLISGKKTTDEDTTTTVTTGWVQGTDGTWSYVRTDGFKATGWLNLSGSWFYLKADGVMATGWVQDGPTWYYLNPVSDGTRGVMKTGWLYDNGTWYYLNNSGAMKTGWLYSNGSWYYLSTSGAMKTGWINDNGTWYYLYSNGAMAANTSINGYKLSSSGALI